MNDTVTLWIDEDGRAVNFERDMLDNYRDMLDEVYGTVSVAGYDYDTSRLLEQTDEVAFRQGFLDYCDNGWTEVEAPADMAWSLDEQPLREWLRANGAPQTMDEADL